MYITSSQPLGFEIVSEVSEHYLDTVWLKVGPGMTLQISVEEARVMIVQIEDALVRLRIMQSKLITSGKVGPGAGAESAKLD